MADKELDDLTEASTLDGTELAAVQQNRRARKTTSSRIAHAGFMGALVKKAADLTGQDIRSLTTITWDTEVYDVGEWHSLDSNTGRLTVPAGVSKIQLSAAIRIVGNAADTWGSVQIQKNGAVAPGLPWQIVESGATIVAAPIFSAVLDVVQGDYFEVKAQVESDSSVDIVAASSWFAAQKIA